MAAGSWVVWGYPQGSWVVWGDLGGVPVVSGGSPSAPWLQCPIMLWAQAAKSPKVRNCRRRLPVSKRLLAKNTMAA